MKSLKRIEFEQGPTVFSKVLGGKHRQTDMQIYQKVMSHASPSFFKESRLKIKKKMLEKALWQPRVQQKSSGLGRMKILLKCHATQSNRCKRLNPVI
jgi:hypothetical protein